MCGSREIYYKEIVCGSYKSMLPTHTHGAVLGHTGDAQAIMRKSVQCILFVWAPDPPFIKSVKTHH